jgi:RND family efflux transporter MFP subunit
MVRKDQSLIEIDPRPYEAQLKQAEGTLEHDQGLLKQAELDLARYQKAVARDAIAHQTLDDQEQAVEQFKGTVKNDEGQVDYQKVQLSYCHITAPASGRVGLRLVDPGNTIFAGNSNALVVVTQLQPITVVFNVAEDNLSQVRSQILRRTALPVDAFDRSLMDKIATGHLLTIDNQVDTTTGTIRFRAEFDNRDLGLYPNQFVNARMLVSTLHNTLLVPSAAVQRNGVQAFVYKVNSNHTASIQNIVEQTTDGRGSTRATPCRLPVLTNCRMAPRCRSKILRKKPRTLWPERAPPGKPVESVSHLYRSARRHRTADGGDPGGWTCRLHHAACLRVAGSRLPDHPGADLLSRRQSRCDDLLGHRAA